jgi:hypothetical protein
MNFEFQNIVMYILKFFLLMFKVSKICHQDFNLLHTYYIYYTSFFGVKSGEKWLTHNVFHLLTPLPIRFVVSPHVCADLYMLHVLW